MIYIYVWLHRQRKSLIHMLDYHGEEHPHRNGLAEDFFGSNSKKGMSGTVPFLIDDFILVVTCIEKRSKNS